MVVTRLGAAHRFPAGEARRAPVWHVPADEKADAALDDAWKQLAGGHPGAPRELTVKGRIVRVPRAAMGVARFSFHDLCEQPLAASDYLRVAHDFHTLVLDRIPVMDFSKRNEAKRFIILIDTLYDHAVKLVASAAAEPDQLYHRRRRLRGDGVQAHGLAADRDALGIVPGAAARPPQLRARR